MPTTIPATADRSPEKVIADCATVLQRVAAARLPAALDRRLLWLSENKERLSQAEREELLASIEFAEDRTLEKLQAKALLKQLAEFYPHIVSPSP